MLKFLYNKSHDLRAKEFNKLIETNFPHFLNQSNPDIILVAGGDGALHHATKHNKNFNGIYFGKALGTLNFLMNSFDNDIDILKGIESGSKVVEIVETSTIDVYVNDAYLTNSANDVVIGDSINSYLSFNITTKDKRFNNFETKGSGLCISTPLGSTAFNLNNNGRVLDLDSSDISITGVVMNKDINEVIKNQKLIIKSQSNLFVDGVFMYKLREQDELVLLPGKNIKLGFLDKKEFLNKRFILSHKKGNY